VKSARFVLQARVELLAEIIYYNNAQSGLGIRFEAAVEDAAARACAFPRSGSPSRGNTRKVKVKDFPFSLVYREEPEAILIFAVAAHARRPDYWLSRTRDR
jgi:hypothetical protein